MFSMSGKRCIVLSAALHLTQSESFEESSKLATQQTEERFPHSLRNSSPILDDEGKLQLRGRLTAFGLNPQVKHPILLSSKHLLSFQNSYREGTEYVQRFI